MKIISKVFFVLAWFLMLTPTYSQILNGEGLEIVQFNASFNNINRVNWLPSLSDCSVLPDVDILVSKNLQKKNSIEVVPTIILFNDGEEVKRFQANIMMALELKLEDVQIVIDETLMEAF